MPREEPQAYLDDLLGIHVAAPQGHPLRRSTGCQPQGIRGVGVRSAERVSAQGDHDERSARRAAPVEVNLDAAGLGAHVHAPQSCIRGAIRRPRTHTGEAMPELPDVEIARRHLTRWLAGATVTSARCDDAYLARPRSPRAFAQALAGKTIARVDRRGKWLRLLTTRAAASSRTWA